MSSLASKLQSHSVWSGLDGSILSIQEKVKTSPDLMPDALEVLERARLVFNFCRTRLNSTDPLLVATPTLDTLHSNISNFRAHFDAFFNTNDIAQIQAVNLYLDQMLVTLAPIAVPTSITEVETLGDALSQYRISLQRRVKSAVAAQNDMVARQKVFEEKATTIENLLIEEQKKIANSVNEMQSNFSSSQDKRASEYAAWQAEMVARRTEITAEYQSGFSHEQDVRRTLFSESQNKNSEKFKEHVDALEIFLKESVEDFSLRSKTLEKNHSETVSGLNEVLQRDTAVILQEMHLHKKEIEDLVGVIGNLGVTSGYKRVADYARKSLYVWQFLTVLALGAVVFVAAIIAFPGIEVPNVPAASFSSHPAVERSVVGLVVKPDQSALDSESQVFYQKLISRIILSLALGIFATYSSRQAAKFLNIEQRNRKMALELEALGPFIEPLDKLERDKFRVQIGDRSFAVDDSVKNRAPEDAVTLLDILKSKDVREKIAEFIKEMKDGK